MSGRFSIPLGARRRIAWATTILALIAAALLLAVPGSASGSADTQIPGMEPASPYRFAAETSSEVTPTLEISPTASVTATVQISPTASVTPTAQISPTMSVTPTTPPPIVRWEAEAGIIHGAMTIGIGGGASGCYYVRCLGSSDGSVMFVVSVPVQGDYVLWGLVKAIDENADSFYASVDDGPEVLWDIPVGDWAWDRVTDREVADPVVYTLSEGSHTITVRGRELDARLDAMLLTTDKAFLPGPEFVVVCARTPTPTATPTATATVVATATPEIAATVTVTGTMPVTGTPGATMTVTPTGIPSPTITPTPGTPQPTSEVTATPSPTDAGTPLPAEPEPSATPSPTASQSLPTPTPTGTEMPPTATPTAWIPYTFPEWPAPPPTATPADTPTLPASVTLTPTPTPTAAEPESEPASEPESEPAVERSPTPTPLGPRLASEITCNPSTVQRGTVVAGTISVISTGSETARNVVMSIPVTPGLMITEVVTSRGIIFSAEELIVIGLGDLMPAERVDVSYTGTGRIREGAILPLECEMRVTYDGGTVSVSSD